MREPADGVEHEGIRLFPIGQSHSLNFTPEDIKCFSKYFCSLHKIFLYGLKEELCSCSHNRIELAFPCLLNDSSSS